MIPNSLRNSQLANENVTEAGSFPGSSLVKKESNGRSLDIDPQYHWLEILGVV
jgi:hypothetical protein